MSSAVAFPKELLFLNEIVRNRSSVYRSPSWLHRDQFDGNVWRIAIRGGMERQVDFRVPLYNGDLLSDSNHEATLKLIKVWLAAQDQVCPLRGTTAGPRTIAQRIGRVLHLADYFLLHGEEFKLAKHGLAALTQGDIYSLITRLAVAGRVSTSIYDWPRRLSEFLLQKISEVSERERKEIVDEYPEILLFYDDERDSFLTLSPDELVLARVWLMSKGYYVARRRQDYKYLPDTTALAELALPKCLAGVAAASVPYELGFSTQAIRRREHCSVPVRTSLEDQFSEQRLQSYKFMLKQLPSFREIGLPAPDPSIERAIDDQEFLKSVMLKQLGRFRTLPKEVMFTLLREALEFGESYGDMIVDGYLELAAAFATLGAESSALLSDSEIATLLPQPLVNLGVKKWCIARTLDAPSSVSTEAVAPIDYFERLRRNEGLWELLQVLYGATAVATGSLSARRHGELVSLEATGSTDRVREWLAFRNRKSGPLGLREEELRPIPKVVGRMIARLERLQTGLIELGLRSGYTALFASPSARGFTLPSSCRRSLYQSVDHFCDYIDGPKDKSGRRYYYRQHQGRRFFVMLFFWGAANGDMDTLRWFLGHTDIEHLWHYLSEATSGAILRQGMATYSAQQVLAGSPEASELAKLLEKRFGSAKFAVLTEDEFDTYIEDMLKTDSVSVEPEFFMSGASKRVRMLIRVKEKA